MSQAPNPMEKAILRREDLVGKQLVSSDAKILGTVSDVLFTSEGKAVLQLDKPAIGTSTTIGADLISAIGDVILLRSQTAPSPTATAPQQVSPPPFPGASQTRICTRCGHANNLNSRFCIKCGLQLQQ
ncbi:MAG: PRC-barrel domain-containing protein [Nitrososphaerota archaeon]|nr:PRC-barrel domain-containing protein [Nitrososphaerota archaeon]